MRLLPCLLLSCAIWLPPVHASAPAAAPQASAAALRATFEGLRGRLANSPFRQPLHLVAQEEELHLKGHAYAVLSHSFTDASKAFADPAQWCEILMLPFNIKHCEAAGGASGRGAITVLVGRKHTTPLEKAYALNLTFAVAARSADYLRVVLAAAEGPFTTRDYEIVLELAPAGEGKTLLHLGYRYGYGNLARAAMRAYLATFGASKVGFSAESEEGGAPSLVRGMRGVMERNTMRYYLAIEAYLDATKLPAEERTAKMIERWFAATERYPRQLFEMEREAYVAMKRREYERMHAGAVSRAPRTASSSP